MSGIIHKASQSNLVNLFQTFFLFSFLFSNNYYLMSPILFRVTCSSLIFCFLKDNITNHIFFHTSFWNGKIFILIQRLATRSCFWINTRGQNIYVCFIESNMSVWIQHKQKQRKCSLWGHNPDGEISRLKYKTCCLTNKKTASSQKNRWKTLLLSLLLPHSPSCCLLSPSYMLSFTHSFNKYTHSLQNPPIWFSHVVLWNRCRQHSWNRKGV